MINFGYIGGLVASWTVMNMKPKKRTVIEPFPLWLRLWLWFFTGFLLGWMIWFIFLLIKY